MSHLGWRFGLLALAALLIGSLASCRFAPGTTSRSTMDGTPPAAEIQPAEKKDAALLPTASSSRISTRIPVDADTIVFTVGEGFLWVGNLRGQVCRYRLADNKPVDPCTQLPFLPASISTGRGFAWVSGQKSEQDTLDIRVARISEASGQLEAVLELRLNSNGNKILYLEDMVWLTDPAELTGSRILRIHPETNQIVGEPIKVGTEPLALVPGDGWLWTANHDDGTLNRLDAKTGTITATVEVGVSLHGLAFGSGSLWTANSHDQSVSRIDAASQKVADERIRVDLAPELIAAGDGAVWAAAATSESEPMDDRLVRIDPVTNQVVERRQMGARMMGMLVQDESLWILMKDPREILILSP